MVHFTSKERKWKRRMIDLDILEGSLEDFKKDDD